MESEKSELLTGRLARFWSRRSAGGPGRERGERAEAERVAETSPPRDDHWLVEFGLWDMDFRRV